MGIVVFLYRAGMQSFSKGIGDEVLCPPAARLSSRVVGAYAVFIALLLGLVELQPRAGGDMAVLAAPWSSPARAGQIVAGAGGDIVGGTRFSFLIVARSGSPRFAATAYAHGAWLVFDAGLIAGCRVPNAAASR